MRAEFKATCQYCGVEFVSRNIRRLYCSERCRRDFQDDRRMAERAELREFAERVLDDKPHWMQDPWQRCDEGGDDLDAWRGIWGNALLDAAPIVDDAPWEQAGVASGHDAKQVRKPKRKRKKHAGQCALPGMEQWIKN